MVEFGELLAPGLVGSVPAELADLVLAAAELVVGLLSGLLLTGSSLARLTGPELAGPRPLEPVLTGSEVAATGPSECILAVMARPALTGNTDLQRLGACCGCGPGVMPYS